MSPPAEPAPQPSPQPYATDIHVELGTDARPVLVRWSAGGQDGEAADLPYHCYALMTPDGTVLIDPSDAAPATLARWESLVLPGGRRPIATVLTNSWHERSSYVLRDRYGIPVWLPAAGAADMEGAPDHLVPSSTSPADAHL